MAEDSKQAESEQDHSLLGDFVKLAVLVWSMAILTANYMGFFKQALDPTFPASLLTGTMAAVGVNIRNKKKEEPKIKETQGASK
tara:strand:- start:485 stop:736 length:252 start_codon:yes stop_codon:yes gene_type:complete